MFNLNYKTLSYLITLTVVGLALNGCMVHPSGYVCEPHVEADEANAEGATHDVASLPLCGDDEYVTESTALKASPGQHKAKTGGNFYTPNGQDKSVAAKDGGKNAKQDKPTKMDTINVSFPHEVVSPRDALLDGDAVTVQVGTCSNSMGLGMVCAKNNGLAGSITYPGPDGGNCVAKGTYGNCSVSNTPDQGKCCFCTLMVETTSGDCTNDGSTTSFIDYEPETF